MTSLFIKLKSQREMDLQHAAIADFADFDQMDVALKDGRVVITLDPETAARLAGRSEIGPVAPVQTVLRHRITEAWEAAGCPS